jgi:hypothetical protein
MEGPMSKFLKDILIYLSYIACLSHWGGGGYFTSSNDFNLPSELLQVQINFIPGFVISSGSTLRRNLPGVLHPRYLANLSLTNKMCDPMIKWSKNL